MKSIGVNIKMKPAMVEQLDERGKNRSRQIKTLIGSSFGANEIAIAFGEIRAGYQRGIYWASIDIDGSPSYGHGASIIEAISDISNHLPAASGSEIDVDKTRIDT